MIELKVFFRRFQSLLALAIMILVLALLSHRFLTLENSLNILRQVSVNLCISIGMTLVILSGGIDLSVGAVLALSAAIASGFLKNGVELPMFGARVQLTVIGAITAGVAVGAALGSVNGLAITRFKLPPFVATLGMLSIARGLTMLWTGGFPITQLGPNFGILGSGSLIGVPVPVLIMFGLTGVFVLVTKRTRFGRHLYAVGGSERAALFTGLRVNRIKISVYMLSGALSGIAGMIVTSRLDSAQPNAGLGYELDSIAAVVIGGTSLSGGRGSVGGTVLGCLIIGVLNNGLFLLNVSPFWQQVVKGLVILIAVAIDKLNERDRGFI